MLKQDAIRLRVPHQDLDRGRFFASDDASAAEWVGALPLANIGSTTRQLYQALTELNRVRLLPARRMALLELLRTPIYYVTRRLTKHYLKQPALLSEQAKKVAELAHALHLNLATAYTIVATHSAALGDRSGPDKTDKLIAQSLHRAMTDHSLNMLRHFQLYEPVDEGSWSTLHQFYSLAKQHQLTEQLVVDSEFGACTIEQCYIRVLLMGCSHPNQLRQEDFMGIFSPLTQWAERCTIADNKPALFVIDPSGDKPPVFRALYESVQQPNWLNFDTSKLVAYLNVLSDESDNASQKIKEGNYIISSDLLGHLMVSWAEMSKRMFMRVESSGELELCLGLSATHHYVSGEIAFETLVQEKGARTFTMQMENPFLKTQDPVKRSKDVWDSPYEKNLGDADIPLESIQFDIEKNEHKQSQQATSSYRYHKVKMINSSAHGYCAQWPNEIKTPLKTGEIIGIRDAMSHNWSIATIRWVSHSEDRTQFGLELISPSAAPYGARIIQKTGSQTDYVRVMVLPEIPALKQPATLLTPRIPFKKGSKVVINQRGKEVKVQLSKKINQTGAYNQFEFKRTASYDAAGKTDADNNKTDDEFDSVWGNL